jgi:hypothetical protein
VGKNIKGRRKNDVKAYQAAKVAFSFNIEEPLDNNL